MKRNKALKAAFCIMLSLLMLGAAPLSVWGVQLSTDPIVTPVTPVTPVIPLLTVPAAPTELEAVPVEKLTIKLTWKDNSSNENGFILQRKFEGTSYVDLVSFGANTTSYTDTLLVDYTAYGKVYYRVRAINSTGDSGYTNEVFLRTIQPQPATNLKVIYDYPSGKPMLTLDWTDPTPELTDYYVVHRSVNNGAFQPIVQLSNTYYDDINPSPSTLYGFRVESIGYFNSSNSDTALFQTPAELPVQTVTQPAVTEEEQSPGSPDFSAASDWAKPEIEEAYDLDLTTDSILSNYGKSITREEFCEIAVKLYEALSGKTALPAIVNPFTDTTNATVLKAFDLGIIKGTSDTTFSPDNPITRQEICVMIYRTLKADNPNLNMDTAGVSAFSDESSIASWAIDAVKYANKNNIMKGTGGNNISPLNNTSREQAIVLMKRTYESFN